MSELVDIQHKVCKVCGLEKVRIRAGKYNHKDVRWVSEDGSLWNGRVCADCHRAQTKARAFNKRNLGSDV